MRGAKSKKETRDQNEWCRLKLPRWIWYGDIWQWSGVVISCRWAISDTKMTYVVDGFVYIEETKCWIYFGEKSPSNEGGTGDEWLVDKMAAKRENSSPKVTGEGHWNRSDIPYFLATKRRHGAMKAILLWDYRKCAPVIFNDRWNDFVPWSFLSPWLSGVIIVCE